MLEIHKILITEDLQNIATINKAEKAKHHNHMYKYSLGI